MRLPKITYRSALQVFRFASEIAGKLPARGDGAAQIAVKLLAIADSAEKVWGRRTTSALLDMHDVEDRTSPAFVRLFWETDLHTAFQIRRFGSDPHLTFIEARGADGQRLFFQEYSYSRRHVSDDFFCTPGFDFAAAMTVLWARYPNGLYLAAERGEHGSTEIKFTGAPPSLTERMTRRARARLDRAIARHRIHVEAGIHRCYLALGPPGTGKTSHAVGLARAFGGRLLNLDAATLPQISVRELSFLLDALRPAFIVIDDFDEAPQEGASARMRFLLAHLKATRPDATIVLTVNDATKLDAALLRSGRIDEPEDFELPDEEERIEIVAPVVEHGVISAAQGARIVRETAGYNHADLAALVTRLPLEPLEEVLRSTQRLRALAEAAAKARAADNPPDGGKGAMLMSTGAPS